MQPKVYQFLVGIFAALGAFLYGYDLGVIGGTIAAPAFVKEFNHTGNEEDAAWSSVKAAVVSIFTGGGFFGAMFAGPIGDVLGRRLTIVLGSLVFCLGGALQTGATSIGLLYAGRVIAGIGVGFLVMVVPLYQAEIAHPSIRGRIGGQVQFMLGIGSLIASWTTYGTNKNMSADNQTQWRLPLGLQLVPAALLGLLILLFPESPRWLIDHGKLTEGKKALARLHANGNERDEFVEAEFLAVQDSISTEHDLAAKGYKSLFTNRSSFRRLILTTGLQASVQMTGVSAIQYFSPEIYKQLQISTTDALKYQGISNVLSIVAQLCTILLIDHVGRRWPLISGNLVNCACFILVTAAIATFQGTSDASLQHSMGWLFIVANWIYQTSFSFTCGPLSWIIPPEVFDTHTRSKGVSIGVMTSFAFNTMIGAITSPAITATGWHYFLLFIICNFTNAVFFWAILPETKKRPLEEMDLLFAGKSWFVPTMKTRGIAPVDAEVTVLEKRKPFEHVEEVE